jgi:DNA-directed RNA polymerase subunit E'
MYRIVAVEEKIRVPPEKLGADVRKSVHAAIAEQMEGVINPRLGIILSAVSVDRTGEGEILPGDAGVYYDCEFKLLTFKPELQEIVDGEVIDNTEFGSFVRLGPMDGLVHISQLMDDFVSFDNKNSVFLGKESKRTLKEGDVVRARVISVSLGEKENKVGLTMRQPMLGTLQWIEEEKRKKTKGEGEGSKETKAASKKGGGRKSAEKSSEPAEAK